MRRETDRGNVIPEGLALKSLIVIFQYEACMTLAFEAAFVDGIHGRFCILDKSL
jgi:hypothetical protein